MPFDFVCPFCHSRTRVEDRFAGRSGPCAECGKPVTLPSPASLGQVSPESGTLESRATGSSTNSANSSLRRSGNQYAVAKFVRYAVMGSMIMLIFGIVAWLLVPSAQRAFEERRRLATLSNIQQIAKALNAYNREFGSYPTPTVNDANGLPLYSWRVLILPYLGYKDLYRRFEKDQAWDSPSNMLLASEMPSVFVVAGNEMARSLYESNYSLVVGPGTLFPTASSASIEHGFDNPAETILVVETKEGGFSWTQPGNLDNTTGVRIGSRPAVDIGGNFSEFALVAMVDGNGVALNSQTPPATIQALLSPDGGESVAIETVDVNPRLP